MKIYNPTGFSSSLTGSFSGSVKGTFEGSFAGDSLNNISGAFDSVSASLASNISLNASSINSLNAATGSYLLNTTDTLDGDLTVTGKITAQEFHTEFVSASIIYQSGSTQFGNSPDDTHTFSGNVQIYKGDGYDTGTGVFNLTHAEATRYKGFVRLKTPAGEPILSLGTYNDPTTYDTLFLRSGNVGIGTDVPNRKFHISGGTNNVTCRVDTTEADPNFTLTTLNQQDWSIGIDYSDGGKLKFDSSTSVGADTKFTFTGGGNLGIGVTSPGAKLDVDGNIISGGGNSIISGTGLFTTSLIQLHNGGAATSNINRMADIVLANNTSYTDGLLGRIIAVNSSLESAEKRNAQIGFANDGATNSGKMTFSTSYEGAFLDRMTIQSNGTINEQMVTNYGSRTPNLRLSNSNIFGLNYADGSFYNIVFGNELATNSHLGELAIVQENASASTASSMRFYTNGGGGNGALTEKLRITAAGDVGIGTTSPAVYSGYKTLHIGNGSTGGRGIIKLGTGETTNGPEIFAAPGTTPGNRLYFNTDSSITAIVIDGSQVGIGTDTPAAKLDVNGVHRFRGDTYNEYTWTASGNYTSGTYYNILNSAEGILQGMYTIACYVDTYAAGSGIYFMWFASVPFYWVNTGTNSTNFQDLPTVLGTGHARNSVTPPSFRLQLTSGATDGKMYLQFNPNANWTGMNNTSGLSFRVYLKRLGG